MNYISKLFENIELNAMTIFINGITQQSIDEISNTICDSIAQSELILVKYNQYSKSGIIEFDCLVNDVEWIKFQLNHELDKGTIHSFESKTQNKAFVF